MAKQKTKPQFVKVRSLEDLHNSVWRAVRFQYDGSLKNKGVVFSAQYLGTNDGLALFSQQGFKKRIYMNTVREDDIGFTESGEIIFKRALHSETIMPEEEPDRYETLHQGLREAGIVG